MNNDKCVDVLESYYKCHCMVGIIGEAIPYAISAVKEKKNFQRNIKSLIEQKIKALENENERLKENRTDLWGKIQERLDYEAQRDKVIVTLQTKLDKMSTEEAR